jgi:hypothetical protein
MLDLFFAFLLLCDVVLFVRAAYEAYDDWRVWPGRIPLNYCVTYLVLALVYAVGTILALSRVWV